MKQTKDEIRDKFLIIKGEDSFRGRLAGLLLDRQMDRAELAQELKVNASTVSRWLRDDNPALPNKLLWPQIAKIFKVDPEWLGRGLGKKERSESNPYEGYLKALAECHKRIESLEQTESDLRELISMLKNQEPNTTKILRRKRDEQPSE